MEIKVNQEHGRVPVSVMSFHGQFDRALAGEMQARAREMINGGARHILVNLEGIPYLGRPEIVAIDEIFSSLLAVQPVRDPASISEQIRAGTFVSRHLKIVNASPLAREALHSAGVDMYVEVLGDVQEAISSFGAEVTHLEQQSTETCKSRRITPLAARVFRAILSA